MFVLFFTFHGHAGVCGVTLTRSVLGGFEQAYQESSAEETDDDETEEDEQPRRKKTSKKSSSSSKGKGRAKTSGGFSLSTLESVTLLEGRPLTPVSSSASPTRSPQPLRLKVGQRGQLGLGRRLRCQVAQEGHAKT